jgi:hypothetical protein
MLTEKSRLDLIAPKYSIGRTYPAFDATADMLDGNEKTTIPIRSMYGDPAELRIELVNPILRNFAGAAVIAGSAWAPFKWLVLAFFAIIGDQIKKRFLAPTARQLASPFSSYIQEP